MSRYSQFSYFDSFTYISPSGISYFFLEKIDLLSLLKHNFFGTSTENIAFAVHACFRLSFFF